MNYISMGMSVVPGKELDSQLIVCRDRRGVQLINLAKATAHQLMLSPVPVQYTDMDFMEVIYDEHTHSTHLVTLYYEAYPEAIKNNLDTSAQADREGNKPLMCLYSFNREFQMGL